MKRYWVLSIYLITIFALAGCQRQEQELTFTTIAQGDFSNYDMEMPAIFVIAKSEEVDPIANNIFSESPEFLEKLYDLNYNKFLAVLVLQGKKQITGYSVTVQQVTQQGDQVMILAEFIEPVQGTRIKPAFTYPYHLIAIPRGEISSGNIAFLLIEKGTTGAQTTYFLP